MTASIILEQTAARKVAINEIPRSESEALRLVGDMGFDLSPLGFMSSEVKRRQWLGARILLNELDPSIRKIEYTEHGAPFLADGNHISLSHSHHMVAIILDREESVGIDIQHWSDKIGLIKKKFCSEAELSYSLNGKELAQLHIIWSAKEAMYKKLRKPGVIFKDELSIQEFDLADSGELKGAYHAGDEHKDIPLNYLIRDEYTLVYTSIR